MPVSVGNGRPWIDQYNLASRYHSHDYNTLFIQWNRVAISEDDHREGPGWGREVRLLLLPHCPNDLL